MNIKKLALMVVVSGLAHAGEVDYTYDTAGRLVKADYGPGGAITYTYDKAGNLLSRTVQAADCLQPFSVGCPSDVTVKSSAGNSTQCSQIATWTPPTLNPNCPGATLTADHHPGDTFPLGPTMVTYTAKDAAGNLTTCSFTVTVVDDTPPLIGDCGPNQSADAGTTCQAAVPDFTSGVTATDNCTDSGSIIKSQTPTLSTLVGLSNTLVTITVKDASGNASTCTRTFTVADKTPPQMSCKDITVSLGSSGSVTVNASDIDNASNDKCNGALQFLIDGNPTKTLTCAGPYVVTLKGTDAAGNTATCSATVTVLAQTTALTYTGATSATVGASVTLKATLTSGAAAPRSSGIAGKTVTFMLGSQTTTATTNNKGVAMARMSLNRPAGAYTVTASFAGDCLLQPSQDSKPFTINPKKR